jgi:DNA-binding response OmpR family regulator
MRVLVFDVIETLLDPQALDPAFESVFGDRGVRQQWFQQMLQSALVSTVTGGYRDFTQLGRAALRRAPSGPKGPLPPYRYGELEVDFSARRVRRGGHEVTLTRKEYDVVAYLARNAGKVLTHRKILQAVWGGQYGEEPHYVWIYVGRIRRKIEPDPEQPRYLLTEAGVGYRMPAPD